MARPATCHAIAKTDPTLGTMNCKRLPRHGGEHRPFLTLAMTRRAAKLAVAKPKTAKLTAKGRRDALAKLALAVEDGTMSAGDALSAAAKLF